MNDNVINYILQNRSRYTREGIDRELQRAGFTPEQIAAAWQAVESGYVPPPPGAMPPNQSYGPPPGYSGPPIMQQQRPRYTRNRWFWITLVGYLVGVSGLGLVALAQNSGDLFGVYVTAVLLGTVLGIVLLNRRNQAAMQGLLWGLLSLFIISVVLPFVALVVVFGICLVNGGRF